MRLVYLTIGWVAGVVLGATFTGFAPAFWIALAAVSLAAILLTRRSVAWRIPLISILLLALGALRASRVPTTSDIARFNNESGLTIEGVVIDEPDIRDDRIQLRVDTDYVIHATYEGPTDGLVLVRVPRAAQVYYGDRIRATGILITPQEFDTFSYSDFLARQGVFSIMQNTAVEVISGGYGSPLYATLFDMKARAQQVINDALPEPHAGLLTGILLGNENGISPELEDDFSRVGASHVIAISGFNMTLIAGMVMGMLGRFTHHRKLSVVIGMGVILAYTLLVGANAAVLRAALMSALLVIAPLFKRKTFVPASLAFVALLLSLHNPSVLWDISFQLSFFATLGLSLFVEPLSRGFNRILEWFLPYPGARLVANFLQEPLVVSLAAQITTLPLIVLYFQRLSLVSLPVNLLIVPVQAYLLMIGGLATIVALLIPGLMPILFWMDMVFLGWSIEIVRRFAGLSFADVDFHVDPRLIALYFILLLGGAMIAATRPSWALRIARQLRQQAVLTAVGIAGISLSILLIAMATSRPDGYLHIWLLDVGHSNAVLVQTPDGAQMLVDGGRFPSRLLTAIGDKLPFYDRQIEVLVVTQPDEFDYGALPAVLNRYDVGVALMNGQLNLNDNYHELELALSTHDVVIARAGYTLDFSDSVSIEVLHPQTLPELTDSLNSHAIILRLNYGDRSFLLTSDADVDAQRMVLDAGQWPLADVIQLPQHGTGRSLDTEFLMAVQPQVALLQSDRANRRGDPNPDTLAMLGDIPVFRTDEGGIIHLWTDGDTLWVIQEGM